VRQYLDIGSGIPTVGNVHEIAQGVAPQFRVVYVDIDPVAVSESLEILEGNPNATAIRADVRSPRDPRPSAGAPAAGLRRAGRRAAPAARRGSVRRRPQALT
jgi:S-adenosyl methyltransferase